MIESYDFSQETIITLILKNLISRSSVEKVTNDLLSLMNKEEDEIITNNTLKLTNYDILSIVYKLIGSNNLLKLLLSEISKSKPNEINPKTEIKKEETHLESKFDNKIKENEDSSVKDDNEFSFYNNRMMPTKVERNISSDNIIVEIPTDLNQNNDEMQIDENESSSNKIENIKSEIKSSKYNNNIRTKDSEIDKRPLKSEIKVTHAIKDNKKDKDKLSYHYSLNQGNLYKFRCVKINKKENVAYFSCDDSLCKCRAEYNLKNKIFILKNGHTFSHDEHEYIKYMENKDLLILNHMKHYNMFDVQMKKC
jgi:hypothetical protein